MRAATRPRGSIATRSRAGSSRRSSSYSELFSSSRGRLRQAEHGNGFARTVTLVRGAFFPVSSLAMILFRIWLLALSISLFHAASRDERVRALAIP